MTRPSLAAQHTLGDAPIPGVVLVALFDAYGVRPDPVRIGCYRRLWDLES